MKYATLVVVLAMALLAPLRLPAARAQAQKGEILTEEEQDKVREAQDPAERIELYLAFAQARLDRFDTFRSKPGDPRYDNGAYLDQLLGEYIALNDELKSWIDFQYERNGDMRRGLRALLERGPRQLEELRRVQRSPDAYAADYGGTLRDAVDTITDTLDGATKALADQEKKFGQLKREEKAAVRTAKERSKEERRRTKEEKKLRKRQHSKGVPADSDED